MLGCLAIMTVPVYYIVLGYAIKHSSSIPSERRVNTAITEAISYARKNLKRADNA